MFDTHLTPKQAVAVSEFMRQSILAEIDDQRGLAYVNVGGPDVAVRGTALPLDTWSHIAVTYGGGTLRFFLNGAQVSSVALTGNVQTSAGPLRIGGNSVWASEYFAGGLDEIRIYNRALTQAEIQAGINVSIRGQ